MLLGTCYYGAPNFTHKSDPTNVKPKEKEFNIADAGGLMLRVKPSGAKSRLFNYKPPHNQKA